jgi:hypothetical protein
MVYLRQQKPFSLPDDFLYLIDEFFADRVILDSSGGAENS